MNALIGRFRTFIRRFCGLSSKNLAAIGRWHTALDAANRTYVDTLRLLLEPRLRANTVC